MNKIVEMILEATATISGEKVGEMIKKYKLNKFIENLEREIQEEYINKYENEVYFMPLDNFLEINKFYTRMVQNIFSKVQKNSTNKYSSEGAKAFVEQYPQFKPFEKQIEKVLVQLSDKVYVEFLNSNILDPNNALYIRAQEQMNIMLEKVFDIESKIEEIHRDIRFLTFSSQKHEEKKTEQNEYMELHNILCDDTISFEEKEIKYIKWISENKDFKEGIIYIAANCEKIKDLERAKKYYEYILQDNTEEYELYNNWGVIELKQGLVEQAIERFRKALEYDENNINALYNLATTYYGELDDNETAIQFIQKAYDLKPQDADVVSFYAVVLLQEQTSNCERVVEMLNSALENDSDNFYLNVNLGFCYLFQKKFNQGIDLLEWLNAEHPNEILCVSLLAMMYAMKGVERADKAIPLFQQAYDLTKDKGYLRNITHLEQGDFFDSIMYNYKRFEIYSDEELMQYYKSRE